MIAGFTAVFVCLISSGGGTVSDEILALERLQATVDMLVSIGDELLYGPYSGMLLLEDTVAIDFEISTEHTYELVMWTESSFNFVDFWLTNPLGEVPRSKMTDHATFLILPDPEEAGTWKLQIELLEGAYSDTAYYAVALLKRTDTAQ